MKKIAILAVAFGTSLLAATSYTGLWSGKGGSVDAKYGTVPQTAKISLLQSGSSITGSVQLGNGKTLPISSGQVSGSQITFAIGQNLGTGSFTASGTQMQGTITSSAGKVINFVLNLQQQ